MIVSLLTAAVLCGVTAGSAGLYLLPVLIGWARRVPDLGAVAVINILLGWTLLGWAAALAMALRSARPAPPAVQIVQNLPPAPPPASYPPGRAAEPPPAGPAPRRRWSFPRAPAAPRTRRSDSDRTGASAPAWTGRITTPRPQARAPAPARNRTPPPPSGPRGLARPGSCWPAY